MILLRFTLRPVVQSIGSLSAILGVKLNLNSSLSRPPPLVLYLNEGILIDFGQVACKSVRRINTDTRNVDQCQEGDKIVGLLPSSV